MCRSAIVALVGVCALPLAVACGGPSRPSANLDGEPGDKDAASGQDGDSSPDDAAAHEAGTDGATHDSGALDSGTASDAAMAADTSSASDSGAHSDAGTDAGAGDSGGLDSAAEDAAGDSGFVTASHPAWPQLPSNGGLILKPMRLVTIVAPGPSGADPLASSLFEFGDALLASSWWTTMGADFGLGVAESPTTIRITGPAITTNPDQAAMEAYITSAIAGKADPDGNTMYMLYLPPGIVAFDDTNDAPNTGCLYYGGYHTAFSTGGTDGWGFAQRCGGGLPDLENLTVIGSHEIIEGATDPLPTDPPTGWRLGIFDPTQPWDASPWLVLDGEVGDMCTDTEWTEGAFTYPRMYSNTKAALGGDPCLPTYGAAVPYVNASAPEDWYTVTAGGSVDIPITGFSDAPAPDWYVFPDVYTSSISGFTATLTSPTTDIAGNPTTNNGRGATLTVTAPSAPSGSWAIVFVEDETVSPAGDPLHFWPVGVYIQ